MPSESRIFEDSTALSEDNASFIDMLYEQYLEDPLQVAPDWRERFSKISQTSVKAGRQARPEQALQQAFDASTQKQSAVDRLVEQFRIRGHRAACNNPLKPGEPSIRIDKELDPSWHGLDSSDMDRLFFTDRRTPPEKQPLRNIIASLKAAYCGDLGFEYRHIIDAEITDWLKRQIESPAITGSLGEIESHWVLEQLIAAESLERYLHRKYVGQKRFSLEGAESLIPLLDEIIQRCGRVGGREVVMGMAHRGRLNVLVNIMGRKMSDLYRDFEGIHPATTRGTGDVKYHMGYSSDIPVDGQSVHLALAFNPSHLEIINPVVEGSVRARQDRVNKDPETAVIPVLIHGDAALAGQGVVMETLNMAETRAYTTGGTIHIVINNQIGFTTSNAFDARSTLCCTDVALMVQAPVLHANGDNPESVIKAARLAVDYRMKFKRDIFIDILCYRRHGHNEADEPAVTQPLMYQFISRHPSVTELYAKTLIERQALTHERLKAMQQSCQTRLDEGDHLTRIPTSDVNSSYTLQHWTRHAMAVNHGPVSTAIEASLFHAAASALQRIPEDFTLHPRTQAIMDARRQMSEGSIPLDWGCAENLAYASLLLEGHHVRITGQDVGRGTFFHRHAILHDQKTGHPWVPLQHLDAECGRFHIYDSLLSEEGVLGFEYGYSSSEPETLVIWEAQFGDFANNAQVVIDQFIAAGETKWGRLSGLTLLLPHGYEGQGPEHSSARPERFLQLCAEDNMQVCVPTTPAQMFHLLRRQHLQPFRKPLVVMTPKSLLRHPSATSTVDALLSEEFFSILPDPENRNAEDVHHMILCCGKVYYDLRQEREASSISGTVIVRVEQLYPFPEQPLQALLAMYPRLEHVTWCQEEPANQGAWPYLQQRVMNLLPENMLFGYTGRPASAAPSVGHYQDHQRQQKTLVQQALRGEAVAFKYRNPDHAH